MGWRSARGLILLTGPRCPPHGPEKENREWSVMGGQPSPPETSESCGSHSFSPRRTCSSLSGGYLASARSLKRGDSAERPRQPGIVGFVKEQGKLEDVDREETWVSNHPNVCTALVESKIFNSTNLPNIQGNGLRGFFKDQPKGLPPPLSCVFHGQGNQAKAWPGGISS